MEYTPAPEQTPPAGASVPEISASDVPKSGLLSTRRGAVIFLAAVPVLAAVMRVTAPYVIWIMTYSIPRCLMDCFGLRCPLCGGTRCAAALVRGDIAKAVYYNPYVVAAMLYLLIWYVRVAISCLGKKYRRAKLYRSPERFAYVVLIVTVLFVIVRNLPFYRAVFY